MQLRDEAEIVSYELAAHCLWWARRMSALCTSLWARFWRATGSAQRGRLWGWRGRPYGDFPLTHFLPPCCCTEAISRPPASPLCSIRQAEGGVLVCSRWFPHTPCCQDTEWCRSSDSNTGTLAEPLPLHRSSHERYHIAFRAWNNGTQRNKGIHTEISCKLHKCQTLGANTQRECAPTCALIQFHYITCYRLLFFVRFFQPLSCSQSDSDTQAHSHK